MIGSLSANYMKCRLHPEIIMYMQLYIHEKIAASYSGRSKWFKTNWDNIFTFWTKKKKVASDFIDSVAGQN